MKTIVIVFLIFAGITYGQSEVIMGKVCDDSTNIPLQYASILLAGTNRGTISNSDGEFKLKVENKPCTLIVRYVGYETDTVKISIPADKIVMIKMVRQPVTLSEVVVTDEDPAYAIIREAIKRKKVNRKGLKNFEYNVYSKNIFASEGEVDLLEETFLKGYSLVGKWEKEFILKTHKTENLKKEKDNFDIKFSDKRFLDFSSDTLDILMNKLFLPLADNAFDYYNYKLLNIIETSSAPIYVIKVIPKSKIQPLVQGKIYIEGENYAICKVELSTSKGVRFPYIHNMDINFKQTLGKYDGYWLPDYSEIKGSLDFSLNGMLSLDSLGFHTVNSIGGYKINRQIPDSVVKAVQSQYGGFTADTSQNKPQPVQISDTEIDSLRPVPLTKAEVKAYTTLDSTKTIEKLIKPKGLLAGLIPDEHNKKESSDKNFLGKIPRYLFKYIYANNNRVENITLGAKYKSGFSNNKINLKGFVGYSFGMKKALGSLSFGVNLKNSFVSSLNMKVFNVAKEWQIPSPYTEIINSLSVFFGFEDQFNYYYSTGFSFGLTKKIGKDFSAEVNFISENQRTIKKDKYFTLFNRNRFVRENPTIKNGFDRKLELSLNVGKSPLELQIMPESGLVTNIDLSQDFLKSDFDYFKIFLAGQLSTKTFYNELFVAPYLQFNFEAAYISGKYGPQHIFTPITSLGFYSPASSFKGLMPYQFVGDKMIALHLEHNWRTIIFQSLNLDFLADLDLDIITGVSALKIDNDSNYLPELIQKKLYWETYIGISRIMTILRLDFYYNSFKHFGATLSTAILFNSM